MNIPADIEKVFARLDDLRKRSQKRELGISDFLSPRELHYAEAYLKRAGDSFVSFGGYGGAERKRIYVLPDYMEGILDADEFENYGHHCEVAAVNVCSAGYRRLSHRDYLGAILGLGIERSVVGDILVYGENGENAVVFCNDTMVEFFTRELTKVASEKVRCEAVELSAVEVPERKTAQVNDTVASPRLDCIVGALCSLSREKARSAVVSGLVEVDFEAEERPDRTVCAPCSVSVRGYGRYRVISVEDKTKKGRYRLVAEKFL